ncbi:hypothetical protein [Paraburkholderia sartisoli]|nr:hypothetical protein [Paraburkholderia sartisoli]
MVADRSIWPGELAGDFVSTITALKPTSDLERAELIRDVVDAFRRLQNSVLRFVQMFAEDGDAELASGADALALHELLSILARQAEAAGFGRLRELRVAIRHARSAGQSRDVIFSASLSLNAEAMNKVVNEFERLDATFVGLCVEHVLNRHFPQRLLERVSST